MIFLGAIFETSVSYTHIAIKIVKQREGRMSSNTDVYDVIVVGGGASGLSVLMPYIKKMFLS